jgi:hypothetical protein
MPDYPPLLPAGFQDVALSDFDRIFVEPFSDQSVRRDLVSRFRQFITLLQNIGISGTAWIDGSFVTQKPSPGDIDLVLLVEQTVLGNLAPKHLNEFNSLINNKRETRLRFMCDLYFCDPASQDWRSYWRGWFGFARSEEVKGIARLSI